MLSVFQPFKVFDTFKTALAQSIASILGPADFSAPLTTSLVDKVGNAVATFTRGTTATVEVNNGANELILRTAQIGEARFPGARRVENLLANTTTLGTQGVAVVSGNAYVLSFYGTGSITLSGGYSGSLAGTGVSNRVQVTFTATSTGTLTLTVSGSVTSAQLENVTGQVVQTAGEYVSKGVLSYPYHGAGVDGVKYFDTLLDGSKIPAAMLKGAQIEEARTNLLLYSEQFNNAVWTKPAAGTGIAAVITANYGIAPDGTLTADRVVLNKGAGTTVSDYSGIQQTGASGVTTTMSVWVRTTDGSTKAVALRMSTTISVVSVSGTWQRVAFTDTGSSFFQLILRGTYGTSDSADLLLWGAQLGAGSFPLSYIPTTSAAVTRNADTLTYAYNHSAGQSGSFLCDLAVPYAVPSGTYPGVQIDGGTDTNLVGFRLTPTNGVTQYSEASDSAQVQAALSNFVAGTKMKLAQSFQTNRFIAAKDGVLGPEDTSASVPALTRINLSSCNGQQFNGYVGNVRAFKSSMLTDQQLEDATK